MNKEIVSVNPAEFGIEESRAKSIQAAFVPMLNKMVELEGEYNEIVKLEINEDTCKKAKDLRNKYVKVRTGTAAIHKEQKAFYLSAGRFIDSWKTTQLSASQGIEEKLKSIEKHFENIEKEKIAKLQIERAEEFAKYGGEVIPGNLGEMLPEIWTNFIAGTKLNYETQKAAEEKAEADRIERERKEELEKTRRFQCSKLVNFIPNFETTLFAELSEGEYKSLVDAAIIKRDEYEAEQQRIREENERLRKEQEEAEAKRKKEAEENQKKLDAQKKKADAEKARIKKAADEKLRKEQEEKERLIQAEKDRKAEEARIQKEKEEADKKAAMAPDNDKLKKVRLDLLSHIDTINNVYLDSKEAASIKSLLIANLYDAIECLTDYVEANE